MFKNLVGDKAFYKQVLLLTIPIMIQNGITNLVNMLDNIMIGQVGTLQMTGTAVSNQLIFVFNLCIFGAVSGAGIFGAQFYGKDDHEGVRQTFRFKLIFCVLLTIACMSLFVLCGDTLINAYLKGEGSAEDIAASLKYAKQYLMIMVVGLIPYTMSQCYSSTLRETGKTVPPMVAGIAAVFVNLVLNYILIFGHLGIKPMGVAGAAVATVISRFVELFVVAGWTHKHKLENMFIIGAYRSLYVKGSLIKQIFLKGLPLMVNETLWSGGVAIVNQCYSVRGLIVVSANNIAQTFFNVFSVTFISVGVAIGIILGQLLGAGKNDEARDTARKLIVFSVVVGAAVAAVYAVLAEWIPLVYNTTDDVRKLATGLMQICAIAMPLDAFANAAYFTLRSGGKTIITIVFDSCFMWFVNVPVLFVLSRYTDIGVLYLCAIHQSLYIVKCSIGYYFVKKGIWIRNIVSQE